VRQPLAAAARHIECYPNRKPMLWAALGIGLVALARRR